MKTYLPYYFRKIGIVTVFVAIVISFIGGINSLEKGYVDGYNWGYKSRPSDNSEPPAMHYKQVISTGLSDELEWVSVIFSFSGFLLYLFSKERTEDELIQKLRYKSLEKSLIFTWVIAFVSMIFQVKIFFSPFFLLQVQLVAYVALYQYYRMKYEIL